MGIGSYRHLVTLEHPVVVLDPPTWFCSLQPAGAQVAEGLAAFFIRGRFHPGIGLETQINFDGRTFQVQAVNDLDERHKEIQVTAVEVVGRGTTPSGVPSNVPPTIVEGPASATIDAGESVILTVIAAGAAPLAYQWTADGVDLAGEIHQFLDTGPITVTTTYAVRVSNAYGSVLSAPAIVTVDVVTYQEQVIADGAVAYWPLDDPSGTTARDLMGTYDGTISGGVTLNQPGVTVDSACMAFDGTGMVKTTLPVTIPLTATLEIWAKTVLVELPYHFAFSARHTGTGDSVYVALKSGGLSVGIGAEVSSSSIADGSWHLVAVVFEGAGLTIYKDGALDNSGSIGRTVEINRLISIGNEGGAGFPGSMQDVAIYPRALTPAEILAHYQLRVPA